MTSRTTVAMLEERVAQLEELVKALTANKTVIHRPQQATVCDPEGVYPRVDGRGRHYRMSGYNVRAYAPEKV